MKVCPKAHQADLVVVVGKGTQAERLMKKYALASVSSGDLLRQSVRDQTSIGEFCVLRTSC